MANFKLDFLSFGGTIAMVPQSTGGVVPGLNAEDLAGSLVLSGVEIRTFSLASKPSANMTRADIARLAAHIRTSDADGFVVTQGTDTLADSSFLAHLICPNDRPIIFTGAMRPPGQPGADGPGNIHGAVQSVLSGQLVGVWLFMNGEIHDPALVRKAHTTSVDAFKSDMGPAGLLVENRVHLRQEHHDRPRWTVPLDATWPTIPIIIPTMDDDISIYAVGHCGALVVAAYGGGHVSEAWAVWLKSLASTMPVVLSTMVDKGPILKQSYGYVGSEMDLIKGGLEPAGFLGPAKISLLLSVLMVVKGGEWRGEFRRYVDYYIR